MGANMIHKFSLYHAMVKDQPSNKFMNLSVSDLSNMLDNHHEDVSPACPIHVIMIHPKTGKINNFDILEVHYESPLIFPIQRSKMAFYYGWDDSLFFNNCFIDDQYMKFKTIKFMGAYK